MEIELFDGGPPVRIETWLRLRKPGQRRVVREAALMATIAWLPLALLAAAHGDLIQSGAAASFLIDFGVHARYLIALPALIIVEPFCIARLGGLARHFLESGLIRDSDRPAFDAALASTRRLRDSNVAEAAVVISAYALALVLMQSLTSRQFAAWYLPHGADLGIYSPAGWWHALVSLPLLLILLLGWAWRLIVWIRFLWVMSRLDLWLLPSHPDHAAGLKFVGHSLRAFALPSFGFGVIIAGTLANRVVHEGASPLSFKYAALGLALVVLTLFTSPLLVFAGPLLEQWRRGVLEYGALANRVGHEFESKWLDRQHAPAEDLLNVQAFSATTDLYQVVANVYEMRFVPVDLISVVLLLAATLAPLVPVVLMSAPLDVMLKSLASLLI